MEARLRELEATLRGSAGTEPDDPSSRLHALETKLDTLALTTGLDAGTSGSSSGMMNSGATTSLKQLWEESDKLMQELDPGSALTHQQQIAAPILYRRQQVLASADSLQRDMQQVGDILTLLAIGQPQMITKDNAISEMQVTKAPILTQSVPPSPADQERLVQVEKSLYETRQHVESMAARMDRLVASYHALVSAVSEKMVLADEAAAAAVASTSK